MNTDQLRAALLAAAPLEIQNIVDGELRHSCGKQPFDYLRHWLRIARCFAYATQDESWGEFEKEFTIIVTRMIVAERLNQTALNRILEIKGMLENSHSFISDGTWRKETLLEYLESIEEEIQILAKKLGDE